MTNANGSSRRWLRGQALLIHRTAQLLYGDSVRIQVEVDPKFATGSFVIPVHIMYDGFRATENLLTSPHVGALADLSQIIGFYGSPESV
jgi:hypothetical protein